MSDSVAKSDIEDVLSSIRRLVSEHGRKVPLKQPAMDETKPDRLVLTPALRVDEASNGVKAQASKGESAEPGINLGQPSKEPVARTSSDAESFSSAGNGNKDADFPDSSASSQDNVASDKLVEEANSQTEPEGHWSGNSKIGPLHEELADSLSAKIEALETAIAQTEDQWEPDGESDDAYSGTRIRRITLRLSEEPLETEAAPTEANRVHADPTEGSDEGESQGGHQPEDIRADAAPQFVHVSAGRNEQETSLENQEEPPSDAKVASDPEPSELDLGEGQFDEEALRVMVADIVREELQGALGERITRNVRKLVRREIQIALAARDLK